MLPQIWRPRTCPTCPVQPSPEAATKQLVRSFASILDLSKKLEPGSRDCSTTPELVREFFKSQMTLSNQVSKNGCPVSIEEVALMSACGEGLSVRVLAIAAEITKYLRRIFEQAMTLV